jgi:hypothetical protein
LLLRSTRVSETTPTFFLAAAGRFCPRLYTSRPVLFGAADRQAALLIDVALRPLTGVV